MDLFPYYHQYILMFPSCNLHYPNTPLSEYPLNRTEKNARHYPNEPRLSELGGRGARMIYEIYWRACVCDWVFVSTGPVGIQISLAHLLHVYARHYIAQFSLDFGQTVTSLALKYNIRKSKIYDIKKESGENT
ncbi:hypothetical protein NQ318_002164 [Aromia moschata]|uniref:Uncharacterized protein n=1 Tax=Aromia moschata TaxID=1265417 RepID=A0AAV8XGQ8_9CUCU|nr:hypothetical protein NQ318_002164 [Aromia moschata]